MNMSLFPFFVLWCVLALIVLAMMIWRRAVSTHEDTVVHVMADAPALSEQVNIARKLETIDKWGKMITAVTVIYGLALGGLYIWQTWVRNSMSSGQ